MRLDGRHTLFPPRLWRLDVILHAREKCRLVASVTWLTTTATIALPPFAFLPSPPVRPQPLGPVIVVAVIITISVSITITITITITIKSPSCCFKPASTLSSPGPPRNHSRQLNASKCAILHCFSFICHLETEADPGTIRTA